MTRSASVVDDLSDVRTIVAESPDAGRLQPIGLREIVRGAGAINALPDVLERVGVARSALVAVLTDKEPKQYHDGDALQVVLSVLGRTRPVEVVQLEPVAPAVSVLVTESTIAGAVTSALRSSPGVLVSLGSGTVADIGKVVAQRLGVTHVIVQTAASVNGFADDQSVLLVDGVKRTTPSRWPDALIIDSILVAAAPADMTRSGLGDQLSTFSAAADWYLASAVGFDASYSTTPVDLSRQRWPELAAVAGDLARSDEVAVEELAHSLTLSGLAMGVAGRTAPSSGTEHLVSHLLEMRADAQDVAAASHGSQVGAASVLAGLIWQRVRERLRGGSPTLDVDHVAGRDDVYRAFGDLDATGATAEECWRAYERKSSWIVEHKDDLQGFLDDWPRHDEALEDLLGPGGVVASTLQMAGAPTDFSQLNPAPAPEVVQWAVTNCYLMRDRFCVVDLASALGAWSELDVDDLLAEQGRLVR